MIPVGNGFSIAYGSGPPAYVVHTCLQGKLDTDYPVASVTGSHAISCAQCGKSAGYSVLYRACWFASRLGLQLFTGEAIQKALASM